MKLNFSGIILTFTFSLVIIVGLVLSSDIQIACSRSIAVDFFKM